MNVKGLGQEIWGEIGAGSGVQWRCGGGGRMGFARRWEGTPRIGNPTIASGSRGGGHDTRREWGETAGEAWLVRGMLELGYVLNSV